MERYPSGLSGRRRSGSVIPSERRLPEKHRECGYGKNGEREGLRAKKLDILKSGHYLELMKDVADSLRLRFAAASFLEAEYSSSRAKYARGTKPSMDWVAFTASAAVMFGNMGFPSSFTRYVRTYDHVFSAKFGSEGSSFSSASNAVRLCHTDEEAFFFSEGSSSFETSFEKW